MMEELDPEIEWHPALQMLLGGEATVYRGHEGVRDFYRDTAEAFTELQAEQSEVRDLGERVVVIGRFRGRGRESGARTETVIAWFVEFNTGKAVRVREYLDPNEALEAAGLRERAMSQENVEVAREMVDSFDRRDVDALLALVRPDVEWDDTEGWPGIRGVYRGRAGVREWWDAALEVWGSVHAEVEEITEGSGGRVFLGALGTFRGGGSGVETEARAWYVLWLVDGKIARWRLFWARDEALEAAGLEE